MFTRSMKAAASANITNTKLSFQKEKVNKMATRMEVASFSIATKRKSQGKRPAKISAALGNYRKKRRVEMQSGSDSQKNSMTLVDLIDDVLLNLFRYLNWNDSINLAATCSRFRQLNYVTADKKCTEFDLDSYMENTVSTKMFKEIAPQIVVLKASIQYLRESVMRECKNVKCLRIAGHIISRSDALKLNAWIKKLELESLSFDNCADVAVLLDGVTELQELESNSLCRKSLKFLENSLNLERLSIDLDESYNFYIFQKLQNLKCLRLGMSDLKDIGKIQRYAKLDGLTELSLTCHTFSDESVVLLSFLEQLTKTATLDKLEIVDCNINNSMFRVLTTFNLRALSLCSDFEAEDFSEFIKKTAAPHLRHLKLSNICYEHLCNIVTKWTSLETICIYVDKDDFYQKIADQTLMHKILEMYNDRSPLRLHIRSMRGSKHPDHIEVRNLHCFRMKCLHNQFFQFIYLFISDLHQLQVATV